jgi:7-alpha-hydroxysteroid dehydrogenase
MILDRFRLDGKVALVTGAGRGIGEGIAKAFAEAGADVVVSARTRDQLESVAAQIRAMGRRALVVPCDVMERSDMESLVELAVEEFGRIDILVNNAGGGPYKPALRTSLKAFEDSFRFSVSSAFLLTRLVAPHMLKQGGGCVLNISSVIGKLSERGFVAYGTAKAAMSQMTVMLGNELAPHIRVNAVASGAVETSALAPFLSDEKMKEKMVARTPMGRIGRPEDIAAAALYLCSDAASYVTGSILDVDGGAKQSNFPLKLEDLSLDDQN